MLRKLFATFSLVGLDIQSHEVRIVYLKKWRQKHTVVKAIAKTLPSSIFIENHIRQWSALTDFIRELVMEHQLQGCPTAICLPSQKIQSQKMTVPRNFSNQEVEAAIKLQLDRDLPGVTEKLCVDFIEFASNKSEIKTIFSVVTKEEYLSQYIKCVNDAGLKVCVVDVDIYALQRILCVYLPIHANQISIAVLYECSMYTLIAFNQTEILFHDKGEVTLDGLDVVISQKLKMHVTSFAEAQYFIIGDALSAKLNWSLVQDLMPHLKIHMFDWSTCFESVEEKQISVKDPNVFILASGLAMREIPLWS